MKQQEKKFFVIKLEPFWIYSQYSDWSALD